MFFLPPKQPLQRVSPISDAPLNIQAPTRISPNIPSHARAGIGTRIGSFFANGGLQRIGTALERVGATAADIQSGLSGEQGGRLAALDERRRATADDERRRQALDAAPISNLPPELSQLARVYREAGDYGSLKKLFDFAAQEGYGRRAQREDRDYEFGQQRALAGEERDFRQQQAAAEQERRLALLHAENGLPLTAAQQSQNTLAQQELALRREALAAEPQLAGARSAQPARAPNPTENQRKATALLPQAMTAASIIEKLSENYDLGAAGSALGRNMGTSKVGRQYNNALNTLAESWIRLVSGAEAPPREIENFVRRIRISFADSPEVRKQKSENIQKVLRAIEAMAGQPPILTDAAPAHKPTPRKNAEADPLGILE